MRLRAQLYRIDNSAKGLFQGMVEASKMDDASSTLESAKPLPRPSQVQAATLKLKLGGNTYEGETALRPLSGRKVQKLDQPKL